MLYPVPIFGTLVRARSSLTMRPERILVAHQPGPREGGNHRPSGDAHIVPPSFVGLDSHSAALEAIRVPGERVRYLHRDLPLAHERRFCRFTQEPQDALHGAPWTL